MTSGTSELLERRIWRCWRDEGGRQVADTVALIAVVLALMGALAVALAGGGGQVGDATTGTVASFITSGAGQTEGGAAAVGQPGGTVDVSALSVAAMGVPNLVLGQISAPEQLGQALSNFWNSLPNWLQGGLIALIGALVVVAVFLALVAAGVVTAVSLPVAGVIGAIALAVAFIAGAVYVLVTGRVDVLNLLGLGAASALAVIVVSIAFVTGALGSAWVAVRAGAVRLWGVVAGFLRWGWGQVVRFGGWVRNTAAPTAWRIITAPFRWLRSGWRWLAKNLDVKFRPIPRLSWEIKISDVMLNLIKLYGYTAVFKEVWVNGATMPLWQWIALGAFAVISAYVPAGGFARVAVKTFYDFASLWITGGVKFFNSVWDKIFGSGQPSSPTPIAPSPSPAPSGPSPQPPAPSGPSPTP